MVLDTSLPEVLARVARTEVELDRVFVITLRIHRANSAAKLSSITMQEMVIFLRQSVQEINGKW